MVSVQKGKFTTAIFNRLLKFLPSTIFSSHLDLALDYYTDYRLVFISGNLIQESLGSKDILFRGLFMEYHLLNKYGWHVL